MKSLFLFFSISTCLGREEEEAAYIGRSKQVSQDPLPKAGGADLVLFTFTMTLVLQQLYLV